jgi:uncharacterized protein YndB with AHSA1/START domain
MEEPKVVHNTFVVERSFPKPPETVFAAFADPVKKRRWFAPGDQNTVEEFTADFKEGGTEHLKYVLGETTPFPGTALINESRYQEIVPNKRIVTASTMKLGDHRISASQVTFELLPTVEGTDLICTHQGAFFEGADGPRIREAGWQTLLNNLGKELER